MKNLQSLNEKIKKALTPKDFFNFYLCTMEKIIYILYKKKIEESF